MRIASLLPSATEICFALSLGDQLVGVTHECDFPAAAREKPQLTRSHLPEPLQTHSGSGAAPEAVGRAAAIDRHVRAKVHSGSSLYALDADLLERLAPDLIVTQELCEVCAVSYEIVAAAAKRLRGDPRVVSLEPSSLEDVFANIDTVAELAGVPERAGRLIDSLRARVETLARRTRELMHPATLVLEWTDPPMSGGHWTPGLVELAGGRPILAHPGTNSQTLAWDAIVAADPDVILVAPCGFDLATARGAVGELGANEAWRGLRAVREGCAWIVDGNAYVNRPGPRLVDTAEIFAAALHEKTIPADGVFAGALARAT